MQITLGNTPHDITVALSRNGDFVTALVADQTWPAGTEAELQFARPATAEPITPIVWEATVDGMRISWDRPAADCAAVLDAGATSVLLIYGEADGTRLLWGKGRARAV